MGTEARDSANMLVLGTPQGKETIKKALVSAGAKGITLDDKEKDKHDCKGKNDCKGKGGCKTGDNGCKGKNSCKGKGGCKTNEEKKEDKKEDKSVVAFVRL